MSKDKNKNGWKNKIDEKIKQMNPLNQLLKIKMWGSEWKKQMNGWHGDGQMQRLTKKILHCSNKL